MPTTTFVNNLVEEVLAYFDAHGINYDRSEITRPTDLAESYFYILAKTIVPIPRSVHYSRELSHKLHTLEQRYRAPIKTIVSHFRVGHDVSEFLSKRAIDATSRDGLLSDFGIHHFHLNTKADPGDRWVQRSDYLLFAFVQHSDVYLLDVRRHPNDRDPMDFGWCDTDMLNILDSNWPDALTPYIIRGVNATTLTKEQKKELRRKNVNTVAQIGTKAISPPGGGQLANGRNASCKMLAMRLLHQIEEIEQILANRWDECKASLEFAGLIVDENIELRLVRVGGTGLPNTSLGSLTGDLAWSGFGIAESTSGTFIDWRFD